MINQLDALTDILNQALDIVKKIQNDKKRGEGALGVGVQNFTVEPRNAEILINITDQEKKSKKKKICAHNCAEQDCEHKPKNSCPFWKDGEEIKCADPYCMFGDFWAIYPRKSSRKRAHQAWARCTLKLYPEKILQDVADRKLRHSQWLKDHGKFINHAATYLNQALWNDPILDEKTHHERSKYQQFKSSAKIYPIESLAEKSKRQRDAIRAAERARSEKIIN